MKIDTIIKIPENINIRPISSFEVDTSKPSLFTRYKGKKFVEPWSHKNDKTKPLGFFEGKINHIYRIEGPLGWSYLNLSRLDKTGSSSIRISIENKCISIRGLNSKTNVLYKKLIENKFKGVSRGFCVTLDIVGVGYRAMILGDNSNKRLCLKVGTSHDIHYKIPKGVGIFLQSPTSVCIFGVDLNQVTQCAHSIRSTRVPSRYKSKGIRLSNEKIEMKAGKR